MRRMRGYSRSSITRSSIVIGSLICLLTSFSPTIAEESWLESVKGRVQKLSESEKRDLARRLQDKDSSESDFMPYVNRLLLYYDTCDGSRPDEIIEDVALSRVTSRFCRDASSHITEEQLQDIIKEYFKDFFCYVRVEGSLAPFDPTKNPFRATMQSFFEIQKTEAFKEMAIKMREICKDLREERIDGMTAMERYDIELEYGMNAIAAEDPGLLGRKIVAPFVWTAKAMVALVTFLGVIVSVVLGIKRLLGQSA
jgi:hypothetical protein